MTNTLQMLNVICSYFGAYSKTKRNILLFDMLASIFAVLMFWSVGNTAAILPVLATTVRYLVFMFKDKYKTDTPLILCLIMHLVVLIISTHTIIDVVPSVLTFFGALAYWYLDNEKLKAALFLINIPWMLYYFLYGLNIAAINVIVQDVLIIISFVNIINRNKEVIKKLQRKSVIVKA